MKYSLKNRKKGELEDIILNIGLVLGILLIGTWFIFFMGKQTTSNQNIQFSTLNKFSTYYEILLNNNVVKIKGVQINSIEGSNLSIKNKSICIRTEGIIDICNNIISNYSGIENSYILDSVNFFNFEKKEDGSIIIEKKE